MMIGKRPMRTETVPIGPFHLVQKLYSFLDLPRGLVLRVHLFISDLASETVGGIRAKRKMSTFSPDTLRTMSNAESTLPHRYLTVTAPSHSPQG